MIRYTIVLHSNELNYDTCLPDFIKMRRNMHLGINEILRIYN